MYIQITTRCNMRCKHCCYSCRSKGQDMTIETYRAALKFTREYDNSFISLGGGEPTIHPLFWQFLGEAIACAYESVWLATNGSQTETSIALAKMAKKGIIGCALSQDIYHDSIDPEVIQAFTKTPRQQNVGYYDRDVNDGREIRDVTGKEIKSGRCKTGRDECPCDGLMILSNGDIRACGCKKAPIFGNVNGHISIPKTWETNECYRNQPK